MNSNFKRAYRNRLLKLRPCKANCAGNNPSGHTFFLCYAVASPGSSSEEKPACLKPVIPTWCSFLRKCISPPAKVSPNLIANALANAHTSSMMWLLLALQFSTTHVPPLKKGESKRKTNVNINCNLIQFTGDDPGERDEGNQFWWLKNNMRITRGYSWNLEYREKMPLWIFCLGLSQTVTDSMYCDSNIFWEHAVHQSLYQTLRGTEMSKTKPVSSRGLPSGWVKDGGHDTEMDFQNWQSRIRKMAKERDEWLPSFPCIKDVKMSGRAAGSLFHGFIKSDLARSPWETGWYRAIYSSTFKGEKASVLPSQLALPST